jgi:KDO2-lipid IV(A) lauroyltransferase
MIYRLTYGVLWLLARLPLPLLHGIGYLTGNLLALLPNRLRSVADRNIRQCLPEQSEREHRRLLRACMVETARAVTETGALWLRPGKRALRLIRAVEGRELVDAALAGGRGVILATPHLGSWEAAGLYGAASFGMTCLYRPLRLRSLERLVREARERPGARYVPASTGGIRVMYQTLEEGGTAALLPDQEPSTGAGVFAPFFGIPAWSGVLLARMARRTGAPVVFAWCERLPRGRGYHLYFRSAPADIDKADLEVAASAMNRAVETLVRGCPQQYQWGYRRFKRRPQGEAPFYPVRHRR